VINAPASSTSSATASASRSDRPSQPDLPCILFVGPSGYGLPPGYLASLPLTRRDPVVRGDISQIMTQHTTPGTLILADGVFHSTLSVGHAEIRSALQAGWVVWGVSSMGAIRAAEMAHLGLRGHGRVYQMFADDGDFADDEVCLLHAPMEPYFPLSEPLVHMRLLLAQMRAQGVLDAPAHEAIVASLKNRWFGYRTLELLTQLLREIGNLDAETAASWVAQQPQYRVKTQDLADLLGGLYIW
jgi:hypothetical protein